MKKTAFVHDRIAHEGGAEAVLKDLIRKDTHDEGVIFTYYSKQTRRRVDDKTYRIVTALPRRLNRWFIICNTRKFFVLSSLFDYRNLMFRFPLLTAILRKKIQCYKPSHVIISSFAAAKNVIPTNNNSEFGILNSKLNKEVIQNSKLKTQNNIENGELSTENKSGPTTTLYLHSPMQYIRENYAENVAKLRFPLKQIYQFAALYLRPWDKKERTYDTVYFNSEYTESIAHTLYGMKGTIMYPPVDSIFNGTLYITNEPSHYYIFMGRVVKYVREIDKIIHLFNTLHLPLIIVGDGPDMTYAQSKAGPNIIFTGHIDDTLEKLKLLSQARGYINLAKESFGIGTAEALCCGVPVFGYTKGSTGYMIDETNGYLVDDKSAAKLRAGFEEFASKEFNRQKIALDAQEKFFE